MSKFVKLFLLVTALAAAGAWGWWHFYGHNGQKTEFITALVDKGEISSTISATGTIEPEEVIDIGAQVAGIIKEFGRDPQNTNAPIDYGSHVEEGTVLARIDESLYRAAANQATANMNLAEANVHQAEANLQSMKSKFEQTKRDWDRVQKLAPTKAISQVDIDTSKNAFETATAAVAGCEAAVEAAKRSVEVNRTVFETAQINLNYCTIKAPVKGVIVDRRVNIGQTVVSSLSAPSLFLLAKDLTRLQIWASVNEADIGQIKPGQIVSFRVAAFPREKFKGSVLQVRLNATMTQNVVTYTVVIGTDNSSGRLLPYLTATLDFEVQRVASALRVPNTALVWQPEPDQIVPEFRQDNLKTDNSQNETKKNQSIDGAKKDDSFEGRVWVVDGPFVRPVKIRVGLSDGVVTEVVGGEIREGTPVVVGETVGDPSSEAKNPFAPKLPAKK